MKMIIFTLMLISCSSINSSVPPLANLEARTYDICQDLSGFCYQYLVCTKKFFGICIKKELTTDKIEVNFPNKVEAKKLYDMDFILKVRAKLL